MQCPNCHKNLPDIQQICPFCGVSISEFTHSSDDFSYPEPNNYDINSTSNRPQSQPSYHPTATDSNSSQKQKPQYTKTKSAPKRSSKRPKKIVKKSAPSKRPKKQKKIRQKREKPTVIHKTVKKGRFATFLLGLIVFVLLAVIVVGGLLVHRYGYEELLAYFGFQISKIEEDSSNTSSVESIVSQIPESSNPTNDSSDNTTSSTVTSEPVVSDTVTSENTQSGQS